jgi:anaerobic magnesium-protoporphyrin IX monomethyl ester cyclase
MNVLLIAPPTYRFAGVSPQSFHLGLGYVAAAVRARGHEVQIYDANIPLDPDREPRATGHVKATLDQAILDEGHPVWQEVASVIRERRPDVVGVSVKILDLQAAWKIAEITRRVAPGASTVLGGPLATTSVDIVMRNPAVDFAVRREGEVTFPALLEALATKSGDRDIDGLSHRVGDKVVHNRDRDLIRDLDGLPPPAKDLLLHLDAQPLDVRQRLMGDIVTSRGCAHGCTFCANQAVWGSRRVRMRSPAEIVAEMEQVVEKWGVRRFTIWDDQLTAHRKRAVDLCERLISAKLGATWIAFAHPNTVDLELLELMKAAGCDEIQLGIESGSDRILRLVKKGSSVDRIRGAVDVIRTVGLRWHGFFMIGFPSETRDEMQQTLDLLRELRPTRAQLSVVTPYPGTELFRQSTLSLEGGDWLGVDKFDQDSLLVDTMSQEEFRELARDFLRQVDAHNAAFLGHSLPGRLAAWSLRGARRAAERVVGPAAADRLASLARRLVAPRS